MNILYLCDEYPPGHHGGIGTSVRLLARQMVKMGHNAVVAGLYSPGYGGEDKFEDEGVKVYRFRRRFDAGWLKDRSLPFKIINRALKDTGLMEWDIKQSLASYKIRIEKIIKQHKIDIVEMPDYNDYLRFCRAYIPFPVLSVPVVIKMNGSISYFNAEANKPTPAHVLKMEQTILNQAAAVAAVSSYTAQKSAACLSYPHKITVLNNGIDTRIPAQFQAKNGEQVIFTGSLVTKKGIYQLAESWNIVNKTMPHARLLIFGKGNRQKVIDCLTNEARKTVLFNGHIATERLYEYLSSSVISIFPSYAEAFALAPLEAMACGTAVINSNRTSGPELVEDHINGLLINPDDTAQMAEAILYLLNNPAVCADIAKKGSKRVKEFFDIRIIAAKNISFYNRVLNGAEYPVNIQQQGQL